MDRRVWVSAAGHGACDADCGAGAVGGTALLPRAERGCHARSDKCVRGARIMAARAPRGLPACQPTRWSQRPWRLDDSDAVLLYRAGAAPSTNRTSAAPVRDQHVVLSARARPQRPQNGSRTLRLNCRCGFVARRFHEMAITREVAEVGNRDSLALRGRAPPAPHGQVGQRQDFEQSELLILRYLP